MDSDVPEEEESRVGNYSWTTFTSIYGQATVCSYRDASKCDLRLNPDLENILKESRDYAELAYYWTAWHDAMSIAVSAKEYRDLVEEDNEFAKTMGYENVAEFIAEDYSDESPEWTFENLQKDVEELMDQLRPFYMTLHAFVRMKLKAFYGNKVFARFDKEDGHIPAHILGNMWAQDWTSIENLTKPYPNVQSVDFEKAFRHKVMCFFYNCPGELNPNNYTVESLVEVANEFFKSIGLLPMNAGFMDRSIFERPKDLREMVCHATAYDLCYRNENNTDEGDYRIKMCGQVDAEYFEIIHHEMGHIEYYMQYSHLPFPFRKAANPGFHEAIGDTILLAASSPHHLQCDLGIGLGKDFNCSRVKGQGHGEVTERDINSLFRKALFKLPVVSFAYSMVTWKWEVETGKISQEEYNARWWEIRRESQGIVPQCPRPPGGFDPAAKYHIVANIEYIRYFWSSILQFQLFQGMCTAVGEFSEERSQEKPLFQCDLAGNKEAGELLGKMLSLGSSVPWPDALELVTRSRKLSVQPLINYFQPLLKVLKKQLQD